MTPSVPQPSYPGGGPYGTAPPYIQYPIGTAGTNTGYTGTPGTGILGGAQTQDIEAQRLMLQNFASTYPTVNAAQQGFQSLLGPSNNLTTLMQSYTPGTMAAQDAAMYGTIGAANNVLSDTSGLAKYGHELGGPTGQGLLGTITNAAQGQFANPNLQSAYGNFTGEASGNQPINPIVQQQLMGAGLTNAAENLAPTSLGTGQTGESQVARNFGQSAQQYIQGMQQAGLSGIQGLNTDVTQVPEAALGQLQSLTGQYLGAQQEAGGLYASAGQQGAQMVGEQQAQSQQNAALESLQAQMFPRTQIGLTGTDFANMMIANTQGQNQFNQANFATQMSAAQYNSQIGAENAGLGASSSSGLISAGISAVAIAALA